MYRIEVFDSSMNYASACYADDDQTISLDYLAYDPFQVSLQIIDIKKGYLCHITDDDGNFVADCVVSDVKPDKTRQEISLRPLQALFDTEVFYSPITDAITWIANTLTEYYVNTSDVLQKMPLRVTYTPGSRNFPLTGGYNYNSTTNILSVIASAFSTWDVVTDIKLDLNNKQIVVNVFEQTETQTVECNLENVISAQITFGDSYGSTNKLTIHKTVPDGNTLTGIESITYYLHTDGTINTTDEDRLTPVFFGVGYLEQKEDMTEEEWIAKTETIAKEKLTPASFDNEVVMEVWADDKIVNPKRMTLGTNTTLYIKGIPYYSILTGITINGAVYTLTFGAVRTELTKKLSIERRTSGSNSSASSGGGGGGGGGGVTGVKGDAETVYRVGDVNLTPQNIGAVPTTTTVNGHALTGDITISKSDVGLGNVNNTSDLNKPISTATQTALDAKVDKETGKGLSSNDFTDTLLSKLNGIESGAQVNTVTGVKGSAESSYRVGNINITKANIGLGNVDNTSDANKPISTATQTALDAKVDKVTGKGLSTNDFTDALLSKLNGIESGAQVNTVTGVKGNSESTYRTGNINITKANIGLGNVDNTSDANKPISTATQTALDNKVDKVTGKGLSANDFTDTLLSKLNGIESGAQVNTVTGVKGSAETSYRTGNINITKANIGLGNVDNTSDANKPISTATQTALNGKVSKSGDTMTGTLVVPIVQTGSTDANYFQTRKMRGEGSASTYYHAIDFGYAGHNQVDFYEYGGLWNFYKNTTADGSGKVLVGKISANGWEGNVVGDVTGNASSATTASKATADGSGNNIVDTYATKTALDNKVDKVTGKGLSTNDFTTAEKNKLSGIESGAQVNTITGVKGNAESSYRTGNVNLTPANIGAVPTSRTVNGHALSSNVTVTASDVGLGNVNNTSDLAKPISTATQTALNAKVNKTDIATTSNLGLVIPDGSTITIDADGTIHSVGGGGGGGSSSPSRVLLWTNPSTSTPFPAQNVLSASQISAYTSFEIEVRNYIAENIYNICKITKDSPRQVWAFDTSTMGANSGVPAITNRQVTIDSNGLSFATGYSKTTTNSGSAGATDTVCIPCRIWGIVDSGGTSSITYFESQTTSVASNAEILRITDSSITTETIVLECTFANPSAISGDVTWTSYNGYIAFTGTCTSATTANVTLADKTN